MSEVRVNQIEANEDSISFIGITTFSGTGSFKIPGGNTAQRPEVPKEGQVRYINGDVKKGLEYYNGTEWLTLGSGIVTNGLVLNLDAGNTASYPGSGTTWTDLAGYNNGTLVNGVGYTSSNGGSLVFDGSDDYVSLPNAGIRNLLSTDCTISVICSYSTKVGLVFPTLIGSMRFDANWVGWRLVFSASNRTLDFANASGSNGGNQSTLGFNYTFPDDATQFTHVSCTWIASTKAKNTYINGVLTNSTASSTYGFGENTSEGTRIGSLSNGQGDNFFSGRVANTILYNRALTASEIQQNFNALRTRYGL